MGSRGPAPVPTAILSARGSWRAKTRPGEPKPAMKAPTCPRRLGKPQRQVWRQLIGILSGMGVLAETDRFAIERYCDLLVQSRLAADALAKDGLLCAHTDVKGNTYDELSPWFAAQMKLATALDKLDQSFGLTPSARTRIVVDVKPAEAPTREAKFFGRTGT